ncbi:MAG: hypothetical protein K0R67_2291, partial [Paenibacillus sp.]|nr:hypothetical protein [Paenibacillus sp.]
GQADLARVFLLILFGWLGQADLARVFLLILSGWLGGGEFSSYSTSALVS